MLSCWMNEYAVGSFVDDGEWDRAVHSGNPIVDKPLHEIFAASIVGIKQR